MAKVELGPVVANLVDQQTQLTEDLAILKQEILSQRWQQVSNNFDQLNANILQLHKRLERLENGRDSKDSK